MVVYFVEVNDDQTSESLHESVKGMVGVEYQGILGNYRNNDKKRVAVFVVEPIGPQFKFKMKHNKSTMNCPPDLPSEFYSFYSVCI